VSLIQLVYIDQVHMKQDMSHKIVTAS